jgi:hypothetical protein
MIVDGEWFINYYRMEVGERSYTEMRDFRSPVHLFLSLQIIDFSGRTTN